MNQFKLQKLASELEISLKRIKQKHPEAERDVNQEHEKLLEKFPELLGKNKKCKRDPFEEVKSRLTKCQKITGKSCGVVSFREVVDEIDRKNYVIELGVAIKNNGITSLRYSFEQGRHLSFVKQNNDAKSYKVFVEKVGLSLDYSNFLIKLYKFICNFKVLYDCILPVRFFKKNFVIIKQVCLESPEERKREETN